VSKRRKLVDCPSQLGTVNVSHITIRSLATNTRPIKGFVFAFHCIIGSPLKVGPQSPIQEVLVQVLFSPCIGTICLKRWMIHTPTSQTFFKRSPVQIYARKPVSTACSSSLTTYAYDAARLTGSRMPLLAILQGWHCLYLGFEYMG
jgi:hypothetical protein